MKRIKDVYPKDTEYILCPYCGQEISITHLLNHCTWAWEAVRENLNLYEAAYDSYCPECEHDMEVAECYKQYNTKTWQFAYVSVYRGKHITKEV